MRGCILKTRYLYRAVISCAVCSSGTATSEGCWCEAYERRQLLLEAGLVQRQLLTTQSTVFSRSQSYLQRSQFLVSVVVHHNLHNYRCIENGTFFTVIRHVPGKANVIFCDNLINCGSSFIVFCSRKLTTLGNGIVILRTTGCMLSDVVMCSAWSYLVSWIVTRERPACHNFHMVCFK